MKRRVSSMLPEFLMAVLISSAVGALCDDNGGDLSVFYFFQQWLGSYCNQQGTKCCDPPTGRPQPDFTIYGLWPYLTDGSFPFNCPGGNFNETVLKPLEVNLRKEWPSFTCPQIGRKFWVHEWNKRGACSKSILDEVPYFEAALDLKNKVNLLQALTNAGIKPDNQAYSLDDIKKAITTVTDGFEPWIQCNHNAQGENQLWQVSVCVDKTGANLVNCPVIPTDDPCDTTVKFSSYYNN